MKKYISLTISIILVFCLSLYVMAAEKLHYTFDGEDDLSVVTNTLKSGGNAKIEEGVLSLDGTYGIKLGYVGSTFSVSAMVQVDSTGRTNTIFFKDMDDKGDKWTGILSDQQKPAFWTHGTSHRWETVATGNANLGEWAHIAYVEQSAVGSLYVNGELVGSGNVESGAGNLYMGATYWTADAVVGKVDNVKLFNNALTADEVVAEYENYIDFEGYIQLPEVINGDIELIDKIATKTVSWKSSDEAVINTKGNVTRAKEDTKVTLTALIGEKVIGEYEVTVLKNPTDDNKDIILSYVFDEKTDGEIIYDVSGNSNHALAYNSLAITKDGAHFDGVDDYVKMADGVLSGHNEITITTVFKPQSAQQHGGVYTFGNTTETGYMFLNHSRPVTNLIHFAATKTTFDNEKVIASLPGIRNGEWATVTVVISGKYVSMYIDGELVMDGEMDMKVSDLGETKQNYIGKPIFEADHYFEGYMKEFTIYNYAMRESRVRELYSKSVEYAEEEEQKEYIQSVSFENGIDVVLDTNNRGDVKIGVVVLDENYEVIEFSVTALDEEIVLKKEGTVCVFAFDEKTNVPGNIYVKGRGEGFDYEYTPGEIKITSDVALIGGMAIVAGFDTTGALTNVVCKVIDFVQGESQTLNGDFDNAVTFKLLYWNNLVAMVPVR